MMDYFVANSSLAPAPMGIQSTAGAVPIKNDKGEVSMKKVKVHRYVSGKRPDYAPTASSDEESEEDDFMEKRGRPYEEIEGVPNIPQTNDHIKTKEDDDPRLRRLTRLDRQRENTDEIRAERRRHVQEPEVLMTDINEKSKERIKLDSSESSEDEDLSDEEIERRREALKQRVLSRKEVDEELIKEEDEEEKSGDSSESSSEYEEYTDSEEETGPRLKPVFVRKRDRITVMEKEKEAQRQKQVELEAKKLVEERKKQTLRMVEESIRKESQVRGSMYEIEGNINDVNTDDENDELEYEAWKLRELKRNKRDREEREAVERERLEVERLRNMTEEDRRQEARLNPKTITNKAAKGKYKFLQKYYHRGAFYLDKDDTIYKRDFSGATLEDHFDKTILPKVMQVKNFGRSGRTKYTHLVDQDTTQFDSPWISETAQNLKFHNNQAAGVKQVFERPSLKKRKGEN
ncbi:PREDICTED: microfibrillar-associated protein 1 [Ceratosolen solmsi marchali]|uniref:Microfibrillar-associated protein 1 n=1 Tax=Ceratosolen solmsi marchali TaxID=326594 RepID=A0AAJ6VK99_9HYME|nr:PREDICTED: microfibrillar-associated protein 1 [Ceratosolen solmsi marchali]XP_011494278.1 PREDICTED: microfibrillar-associated protein 1 [Ceratosolen solmsi marchali]